MYKCGDVCLALQNITPAVYKLHTLQQLHNGRPFSVSISDCYLFSDSFKMRTAARAFHMKMRLACKHIHNHQSQLPIKHFMQDLDFKEDFFKKRKEKPVTNLYHKPVLQACSLSYYMLTMVCEICLSVNMHTHVCYLLNSLN